MNSLDKDIRIVESLIKDLDSQILNSPPISLEDPNLLSTSCNLHNRYNTLLRQNNLQWAQCSKFTWMLNEDLNSSFFHASVKMK